MIRQKIIPFTCASTSPQKRNLRWRFFCVFRGAFRGCANLNRYPRSLEDRPQNGAHLARAADRPKGKEEESARPRVLDVCRRSITLRLTSGRVYSRTARSGSSERISRVSRRAPLNLHFICFTSSCLLFFLSSTRNRTCTRATCKSSDGSRGRRLSRGSVERV